MAALWWVIAAFVLAGLEVFALNLVFGTLVVGALSGSLVALLGGGFTAQAITASVTAAPAQAPSNHPAEPGAGPQAGPPPAPPRTPEG